MLTSREPVVGDDLIGREDLLKDVMYAIELIGRGSLGEIYHLRGRRRIGKTSILLEIKRRILENKEKYRVIPIYINLLKIFEEILGPKKVKGEKTANVTRREFPFAFLKAFAKEYLEYFGVRFGKEKPTIDLIADACNKICEKEIMDHYNCMQHFIKKEEDPTQACRLALVMASNVAETNKQRIFIMLDEFQELTWLSQFEDCVPFLGQILDLIECEYITGVISGSAVSIMQYNVFGYGSPLFSRTKSIIVEEVEDSAILKIAEKMFTPENITFCKDAIVPFMEFSAGVPFYAVALCEVLVRFNKRKITHQDINKAIEQVFTKGGVIYDHFNGWITSACNRINNARLTTPILKYLARNYSYDMRFGVEDILRGITEENPKLVVSEKELGEIIDKLDTSDLINRREGMQIPDQTMADWIKVAKFYKEKAYIGSKLVKALNRERRLRGLWFELVLECLFRNFDGRSLPGGPFGVTKNVKVPKFKKVWKEHFIITVMGDAYVEVDVCGRVGKTIWLGESKLWKKRVPLPEIKKILEVKELLEEDGYKVQVFYFAASGVTKSAKKLLKENNAYIVDLKSMNKLLEIFDLSVYKIDPEILR